MIVATKTLQSLFSVTGLFPRLWRQRHCFAVSWHYNFGMPHGATMTIFGGGSCMHEYASPRVTSLTGAKKISTLAIVDFIASINLTICVLIVRVECVVGLPPKDLQATDFTAK